MNEFEVMLRKATKERDGKASKRSLLDREIAALDKTIEGLKVLCDPAPIQEEPAAVWSIEREMLKHAGITDVVRMTLQVSKTPVRPQDIVGFLNTISYPLEGLDNPRATVNTILARLVNAGEAERIQEGDKASYRWIKPARMGGVSLLSMLGEPQSFAATNRNPALDGLSQPHKLTAPRTRTAIARRMIDQMKAKDAQPTTGENVMNRIYKDKK